MCAALFNIYLFFYPWWLDDRNLSSAGFYEIKFLYLFNELENLLFFVYGTASWNQLIKPHTFKPGDVWVSRH